MLRSLFTAISGLRNHQTLMDVVGNNIANVNTTGYKQSRVAFQDIMSQTLRSASAPQGATTTSGRAGTNPQEVGLGIMLGATDTVQTQGTLESTNKTTDMAIQGDGYFVLSDGASRLYSRDGSFDLGLDGSLVNPSNGLRVQGWQADRSGTVDNARPLTPLVIPLGQAMESQPSSLVSVSGNLDVNIGPTSWASSNDSGGKLSVSGTSTVVPAPAYTIQIASVDASGSVTGLTVTKVTNGVSSSVTVPAGANSFTDAATGLTFSVGGNSNNKVGDVYQTSAQSASVTVFDSIGQSHNMRVVFQSTPLAAIGPTPASPAWSWTSYVPGRTTNDTGTLVFDATGKVASGGSGTAVLSKTNGGLTDGAQDLSMVLDFGSLTQMAGAGDLAATTDGSSAATLSSFTVGQSGEIIGSYTNGLKRTLGQIALATFSNPSGLLKAGGNLLSTSANSGTPRIGAPNNNGRGQVMTGFLEMSNVDLAQQFTNMIMAERGFQANSRVITASDEILQDLVNLKRG